MRRRDLVLLILGFVVADLVFLRWIAASLGNWGIWDWDYQMTLLEACRKTLVEFGDVPLWNPYIGGGSTLAGNSLLHFPAPSFVPVLLLGTVLGVQADLFLYLGIAQVTMFRFARRHDLSVGAAALACAIYSFGGVYAQRLTHGHFEWIALAWYPAVLAAVFDCRRDFGLRPVLRGAVFLAFVVLDGGPYQYAFFALVLIPYALLLAVQHRKTGPVTGLAAIAALGSCLSAIKLLPVLETAARFPRVIPEDNFYSAPFRPGVGDLLWQAFLSRAQEHRPDEWMPYLLNVGAYVGWIPLLLLGLGIATGARKQWPLIVLTTLCLWTMLGTVIEATPWAAIRNLPGFEMLRVPARFNVFVLLGVGVLAGLGFDALREKLAGKARSIAAVALLLLVTADLLWVNGSVFRVAFPIPPQQLRESGEFRNDFTSPLKRLYPDLSRERIFDNWPSGSFGPTQENRGTLDNFRAIPFPTHSIPYGHERYRGEAWVTGKEGAIEKLRIEPNRIVIRTNGKGRRLVVNQNHDPWWRCDIEVENHNGLLSIRLPDGLSMFELTYRPRWWVIGLVVTLLGIAGSTAVLFMTRKKV